MFIITEWDTPCDAINNIMRLAKLNYISLTFTRDRLDYSLSKSGKLSIFYCKLLKCLPFVKYYSRKPASRL